MENFLTTEITAFDGILALSLPVLAWILLRARDLFKAVVLFICYGLLMALAWVRLNAVDIALAEAAIGAGVTGALFLAALRRMQVGPIDDRRKNDGSDNR
jgi:uncharacterized MnhB-related membrane protein